MEKEKELRKIENFQNLYSGRKRPSHRTCKHLTDEENKMLDIIADIVVAYILEKQSAN